MPYELIPMTCAAGLAVVFAYWAFRRGAKARDIWGASLMLFAGVTLAGSMAIHSGEVLYNQLLGLNPGMYQRPPGAPHASILGFTYDFRFYSLQLFGGILLYWSAGIVSAAVQFILGSPAALSKARKRVWQILLLITPLIPMHIFAVATAVTMAIAALGLMLVKNRLVAAERSVQDSGNIYLPHTVEPFAACRAHLLSENEVTSAWSVKQLTQSTP